jgi:uncharacterized protein YfaQ (DUF2300 family)
MPLNGPRPAGSTQTGTTPAAGHARRPNLTVMSLETHTASRNGYPIGQSVWNWVQDTRQQARHSGFHTRPRFRTRPAPRLSCPRVSE